MNQVVLMGRLTKDPEITEIGNDGSLKKARYTLAVDRHTRKEGAQTADFISCVAWQKAAEFAEKYLRKGMKIAVTGRIETGSYKKQDGTTVYTTDVNVRDQEFCEAKGATAEPPEDPRQEKPKPFLLGDEFLTVPPEVEAELPFA